MAASTRNPPARKQDWSGLLRGPLFGLAPDGVFRASALALGAVGSYPTFSPLPSGIPNLHLRFPSRRFDFLWHFPSECLSASPPACISKTEPACAGCYKLRGIAPYGVRTFLPHRRRSGTRAILRPSKIRVKVAATRADYKSIRLLLFPPSPTNPFPNPKNPKGGLIILAQGCPAQRSLRHYPGSKPRSTSPSPREERVGRGRGEGLVCSFPPSQLPTHKHQLQLSPSD